MPKTALSYSLGFPRKLEVTDITPAKANRTITKQNRYRNPAVTIPEVTINNNRGVVPIIHRRGNTTIIGSMKYTVARSISFILKVSRMAAQVMIVAPQPIARMNGQTQSKPIDQNTRIKTRVVAIPTSRPIQNPKPGCEMRLRPMPMSIRRLTTSSAQFAPPIIVGIS